MDQGNHYYKCDLQVHTPRDKNWRGDNCTSEEDRNNYSKVFIKECRSAGIDAVAITDHHDLSFFQYIKNAASRELDESGNSIPENERVIVFPGIELTLSSPPCQGLLILDADFPERLFPTVLGALSLAQAPKEDSKTNQTIPISAEVISSINELYAKLDKTDGVKGRYIFWPHVKEKGHQTLMRTGFHEAYSRMPSVGGYIDGKLNIKSEGYRKIINGEVDAYGFKSIAVIQTSDYRADKTLKEIDIATWIKWKRPTAEALRQACLAKESRISLSVPEIPNIYIEKIDVTNSAFLSKFELDFNPQLNSIIGGRGSGKSTILEYLRWCLCDQTDSFTLGSDGSDLDRKRSNLIEKTLKNVGGEVRIFFNVNGTRHIVKRNPNSEDVLVKVGDGDFQSVHPQQIRDLLPIQAYSQKQLSSISIRSEELKRFVEQPIAKEIDVINGRIRDTGLSVKTAYGKLSQYRSLHVEITKSEIELGSYKLQIEQLRTGLKGISYEDKAILNRAKYYSNEKNRFDEIEIEYSRISDAIESLSDIHLEFSSVRLDSDTEIENNTIILSLEDKRQKYLVSLSAALTVLKSSHLDSKVEIDGEKESWNSIRDEFAEKYKKAKQGSTSSEATLSAIKELETKISTLDLAVRQKRSQLSALSINEATFGEIYTDFLDAQSSKNELIKRSSIQFSELSDGFIKAKLSKMVDSEKLSSEINAVFSSHRLSIQKGRADALSEIISTATNPIEIWREVVCELKILSEFSTSPEAQEIFPSAPILESAGFTQANKRKIVDELSGDGFIQIAILRMDFLPKFFYQTNNAMGDEVPFEDASAGQQATALLNVLLSQEGFPLVIDQPEDDIDNRAIEKIIKNLWNSKKRRQIIISSHNANLVVNGDSDLVVSCDYNETSEQTKGQIKFQGSIDDSEIRNEITSIMEGGERAFILRKEKYGF
jgi:type III restriction enzyme